MAGKILKNIVVVLLPSIIMKGTYEEHWTTQNMVVHVKYQV